MPTEVQPPAAILVVDDEDAVNRLVSRYLTHLGYRVLKACSGEEALAIVRSRRPRIDLVLSDVVMPGMDGVALAERLLARCPGPSVILIATAILVDRIVRQDREIRVLRGLLPICSFCKRIRDEEGAWRQLEIYIGARSDARFSHTFCPDCGRRKYPDLVD